MCCASALGFITTKKILTGSVRERPKRWASALPGSQLHQLPAQMFGQIGAALRGGEIRRGVLDFEIAPALKRTARLGCGALQMRIEIEPAALAVIVDHIVNGDDPLAHADHSLDHPIERAPRQHVLDPLRPHARAAYGMRLLPGMDGARLGFARTLQLSDLPF